MNLEKGKNYFRHLIECQCILPIYKNKTKPLYHKFKVFSVIEDDQIEEKYVMCNNCKILHRVTEFNKSEIMWGVEEEKSMVYEVSTITRTVLFCNDSLHRTQAYGR